MIRVKVTIELDVQAPTTNALEDWVWWVRQDLMNKDQRNQVLVKELKMVRVAQAQPEGEALRAAS